MARTDVNRLAVALRDHEKHERSAASDSELLDRFRNHRDNEAFAALVRRHGKTVLAAGRQVLADPADIEDVFQAVFLVLIQKIARIDGKTVNSWLYAVAHRVAVRARSDGRRRAEREGTAARRRKVETLPPDLSWQEAVAVLHEEVDRLPDVYRRVMLLCYLSGQSREEAAASLGWTEGSVKGRLENRYYDPTATTKEDGTFELKLVRPTEQFIQVSPFWLQAGKAPEGTSRALKLKEGEVVDNVVLTVVEEQK